MPLQRSVHQQQPLPPSLHIDKFHVERAAKEAVLREFTLSVPEEHLFEGRQKDAEMAPIECAKCNLEEREGFRVTTDFRWARTVGCWQGHIGWLKWRRGKEYNHLFEISKIK